MLLPTSYPAGVLLLVLAFLCFAIWPNLFKRVHGSWRYELFGLDFALGALGCALLLAYTVGTFGPEMSFTDRLLISGHAAAILVIGAGGVFAAANLLLLASIALLGLAAALPVCFGVAAIGTALVHLHTSNSIAPIVAAFFMLIAAAIAGTAARSAASANRRTNAPRGLVLAALGGLALIVVQMALGLVADPDFGPGPYATALMFAIGLVLFTPALNFFFMNIKVLGSQIRFGQYRSGGWSLHAPGLLSGALWSFGMLALYCPMALSGVDEMSPRLNFVLPALAIPVVIVVALLRWKEYRTVPRSRTLLQVSTICFLLGLIALAFAFDPVGPRRSNEITRSLIPHTTQRDQLSATWAARRSNKRAVSVPPGERAITRYRVLRETA